MRMAVVCPYPVGVAPSQRLKYEQYFPSWTRAGYQIEVFPFWDHEAWSVLYARGGLARKGGHFLRGLERRRRDLARILSSDLVYLHLEAVPLGPRWFERAIVRSGTPFIYDVDDLVQLPHSSPANRFMRWFRDPTKIEWLMARAAHVIVCTEHLGHVARSRNASVTEIPSTIDLDRYAVPSKRPGRTPLVVGWSGSHSTSPYLHLLDDVLRTLHSEEDIRIRVIGDPDFQVPGMAVEALPWSADREVADLSGIDIGVYPLPDEEWVLGKSGLKALQYMALGIPTVATALGSNLRIVEHDVNGLLVSDEDDWLRALRRLVRDPALRDRLGQAGRRTVEERYSVEGNETLYLDVLGAATAHC